MEWPSAWRGTISNTEQLQGKNWSSLEEFAISVFWLCLLMIWLNSVNFIESKRTIRSDLISLKANNGLLQPWLQLQHDDDDDQILQCFTLTNTVTRWQCSAVVNMLVVINKVALCQTSLLVGVCLSVCGATGLQLLSQSSDPIWQVMPHSSERDLPWRAIHSFNLFTRATLC